MSDKGPFDFVKSITKTNEYIIKDEHDEGAYVPWVTNRALSIYPDCIFYAQEMNLNPHLSKRMQHDFLFHSIRKYSRKFLPYPKKKEAENISLLQQVYKYNARKARYAASILSDEQINEIKKKFERGKE